MASAASSRISGISICGPSGPTDARIGPASVSMMNPAALTAPSVTLTIQPGVTLNFATTDNMLAYADTSKPELRVEGKITANGTAASPITLTSTGAGAGAWYGIDFLSSAAGSSLTNAMVLEVN